MPRSSGRRPAPSRPAARPAQSRPASTMAAPAAAHHPAPVQPVQQARQPGMFAQMASTAAGVAVGSAVGHTIGAGISSMFGGSSSAPVEQQQAVAPASAYANEQTTKACDVDARNFTRCLEENSGNFQVCDYYLQQLKACQQAAAQY